MKIRTLNKKDLCNIFGLVSQKSNVAYYPELKSRYFTDEALQAMGMTQNEYNSIRCGRYFTFEQTKKIIEYFQISEEELEGITQ